MSNAKHMSKIIQDGDYNDLVSKISTRYTDGQYQAVRAVNIGLLDTYWQIGGYSAA